MWIRLNSSGFIQRCLQGAEYHESAESRAMGKVDLWMHWTLLSLSEEELLIILEASWMVGQSDSISVLFRPENILGCAS